MSRVKSWLCSSEPKRKPSVTWKPRPPFQKRASRQTGNTTTKANTEACFKAKKKEPQPKLQDRNHSPYGGTLSPRESRIDPGSKRNRRRRRGYPRARSPSPSPLRRRPSRQPPRQHPHLFLPHHHRTPHRQRQSRPDRHRPRLQQHIPAGSWEQVTLPPIAPAAPANS